MVEKQREAGGRRADNTPRGFRLGRLACRLGLSLAEAVSAFLTVCVRLRIDSQGYVATRVYAHTHTYISLTLTSHLVFLFLSLSKNTLTHEKVHYFQRILKTKQLQTDTTYLQSPIHAEHKIHNKFSFWKRLSILFRSHLNTKWPSFIYLNSHSDAFFLSFPHRISLNPFRDPSPHPVPKITKYKDHYIFLFFFFLEGTPQLFESNLHSYEYINLSFFPYEQITLYNQYAKLSVFYVYS